MNQQATGNAGIESNLPAVVAEGNDQSRIVPYDWNSVSSVPDDTVDLREVLGVLQKYRWTIFSVLSLALLVGLVGTLFMRPVYRSTTLLEMNPASGSTVKFENIEQTEVPFKEYMASQQNILRSDSIAQSVIQSLGLGEEPEFTGRLSQRGIGSGLDSVIDLLRTKIGEKDGTSDQENLKTEEKIINRVKERLSIRQLRNSTFLEVSFDSFSPVLAASAANEVAKQYVRLKDERRFSSTSGAKAFLKSEIEQVQARLETSEKELTDYARANRIVDVEDRSNIMTARLEELSQSLTEVQTRRMLAQATVDQVSASGPESTDKGLQEPLVRELKQRKAELEAEYGELSAIYKDDYPAIKQIREKIAKVDQSIAKELSKLSGSLTGNLEELKQSEQLISEALEDQRQALLDLQDRSIQYNILKREWETNKELYSGLLERMKQVGVAAGMELNDVAVVDVARVTTSPHKPKLGLNLGLAGAIGLLLGIGLALLLGYLDNTISSPEELERIGDVTSLGIIPKMEDISIDGDNELELISYRSVENEASEAFRSIRTSLMFSSPMGAPPVLLLTSATPSEGKSLSAVNLALVLAQNNERVLLVDADLRRPRIHKIFQIPSQPGLSEILVASDDGSTSIRRTELDYLDILPAGTFSANPAELLGSNRMDDFISNCSSSYDHVIVDAPPVLGLADSVILSTKCDGVLLVVSANQVSKEAVKETVKRLRMVRAPLVGAILNRLDFNAGAYSYYNSGYYQYDSNRESAT